MIGIEILASGAMIRTMDETQASEVRRAAQLNTAIHDAEKELRRKLPRQ